ncbi:MAG: pyroglutamyl-peptidase I [Bacilli bacterium]
MKKILITAFTPFGKQTQNSSLEVVKKLKKQLNNVQFEIVKLPVVFDIDMIANLLEKHNPDFLLMCGQAGGRKAIECEKIAVNYAYSLHPDNKGVIIRGSKIMFDGPDAFFTTAPVLKIVHQLQDQKFPVNLSFSAGTYVCNFAYYLALYYTATHHLACETLFVHFPYFAGQTKTDEPALKLLDMVSTIKQLIEIWIA